MLDRGEIDAFISPRPPSCAGRNPDVGWLFADPDGGGRGTTIAARASSRSCMCWACGAIAAEAHPWLPAALLKAFEQAKTIALDRLSDTSAPKVTLPFVEDQLMAARALLGHDFWSYGVAPNRITLEAFLRHHHGQGLSARLVTVDELFHPSTFEVAKI